MEAEERSITFRTYQEKIYREEKGEGTVETVREVEDTGIGMNPELEENLLQPFRQASEEIL